MVTAPAIQHPAKERGGLRAEADPAQGEHGVGRVTDSGMAVIPVPHPADRRGQRRRRRGDRRAVDPVVAQLQGDRRPPDQRFLETLVAEVRHPPAPRRGGALQHGLGVEPVIAMGSAPGQHQVQGIAFPCPPRALGAQLPSRWQLGLARGATVIQPSIGWSFLHAANATEFS